MVFNSLQFLIFFPIVVMLYYLLPKKIKYLGLLAASYYFYMCWNAKYAILLLFSTSITYFCSLLMNKVGVSLKDNEKKQKIVKKLILILCLTLNLAVLFYFKYFNFFIEILNSFFNVIHIELNTPTFDILLPVGISFYTFQALSYTIDVYRGDIPAEKNFFRYALFVSFFPQLVAGPIERSKNLLKQLREPKKFDFENLKDGFLLMLWGFFLKVVIADRVAIFVDTVYGNTSLYPGYFLIVATILFAVQLYCDFYGYSVIARGSAKILGIELMENFDAPYFSLSIAELWRKWHISLTSWFRDYLYIPLGGNRKGKFRKYLNILIVFLTSGLWHGASFAFVAWGGLNGLYQIIGDILKPIRDKLVCLLHLNRKSLGHKLYKMVFTFILFDFSFIFFRANRFTTAVDVLKKIFTVHNPWILFDGSLYTCGLDSKSFWLMIICICILIFADFCKHKHISIRKVILEQDYWFRWLFISIVICFILLFGVWGTNYNANAFFYFQF